MKIYRTDIFPIILPEGHPFPAVKYSMLSRRLLQHSIVSTNEMIVPREVIRHELQRVHSLEYLRRFERGEMTEREMRRIGLPWSPGLVDRVRRSVGATVEACFAAMTDGFAVSLSGGTHHAFPDRGEGYCIFNDVAVAVRAIKAEHRAHKILVIDADVHQGNGTAYIFRKDQDVFTFSLHGKNNFPLHKQDSDLDIPLEDGTEDQAYLEALQTGLEIAAGRIKADLAVYLAGADPYRSDRYGRLSLTKQGLIERDRKVLAFCRQHRIRVAVTMAGGYARDINDTVDIHLETVRIFMNAYRNIGN